MTNKNLKFRLIQSQQNHSVYHFFSIYTRQVIKLVPRKKIRILLFVIFIDDMPQVVKQLLKLFPDHSKLIIQIKNRLDIPNIHEDIDSLVDWAKKWRIAFNYEKCKTNVKLLRTILTFLNRPTSV